MIYPQNFEEKIDFPVIRETIRQLCDFSLGKEKADEMAFLTDEPVIKHLLAETGEMVSILSEVNYQYPNGAKFDMRESLSRIRIEGLFLDETEVDNLRKTLISVSDMIAFLKSLDEERFPNIYTFLKEPAFAAVLPILREIEKVLDRYGKIRDNASPELARIRRELVLAQSSVSRALVSILQRAKNDGIVDSDVTPTLREGRLVIPVPPAYKRKLGGIVHDESATGKTVYVEPQQIVEANNRIRELEGDERREKTRILLALTGYVRPFVPDIRKSLDLLAQLDFIHAKALFAKELHCIAPELHNAPFVDWRDAMHPVLTLNFRKQGKQVVPLTISLGDKERNKRNNSKAARQHENAHVNSSNTENDSGSVKNRILVISGPNAGGKSVCLKTVALLQYMLQCGLPIPVREDSKCGLFKNLFIDIGDSQSIDDDLSTYSSHLRNMKHFLRYADSQTLFLIDEFGSGTEPLMGGAIAESVLKILNEHEAVGVITTHYTNLKHFAEDKNGIGNGAMLYDRGQLRPLFQLSIGQAGSSFALEIAKQIGLPDEIIQHTTELVGEDKIDYDRHLQDIARDKRYWENKRQAIRQKEKHLEALIAKYEDEMANIKTKRKEIILKAKEEASQLLDETNATIENTIREIKEAKADREKTIKAREKVEKLKEKVQPATIKTKEEHAAPQKKVLHDLSDLRMLTKNPSLVIQDANIPDNQRKTKPTLQRSTVVDEIRRKKLSFSNDLDLRGFRADEALEVVMNYIDDAVMVGTSTVRILHGTGTGALKKVIRDYLKELLPTTHNGKAIKGKIVAFHDGDPDKGGAGITIVDL